MVSTLGTIYSVGGDDTHESGIVAYLRDDPDFNPAVALSLMVFVLLYMPCVAAMAVIKRETGSWKMLLASDAMCLVLSYVLAFAPITWPSWPASALKIEATPSITYNISGSWLAPLIGPFWPVRR